MRAALKLLIFPLLAILCLGTSAKGQVDVVVFPVPDEDSILISGSIIASAALTTTKLTLTFPGPISSIGGVQVVSASGLFAVAGQLLTVDLPGGMIEINLPGFGVLPQTQSVISNSPGLVLARALEFSRPWSHSGTGTFSPRRRPVCPQLRRVAK